MTYWDTFKLFFVLVFYVLGLFGVHRYGVHVNGYVKNAQNDMFMWIGKRSETKQTWPGKLDNTVSNLCTSSSVIGCNFECMNWLLENGDS